MRDKRHYVYEFDRWWLAGPGITVSGLKVLLKRLCYTSRVTLQYYNKFAKRGSTPKRSRSPGITCKCRPKPKSNLPNAVTDNAESAVPSSKVHLNARVESTRPERNEVVKVLVRKLLARSCVAGYKLLAPSVCFFSQLSCLIWIA